MNYEFYQRRYKELFITVREGTEPYLLRSGEKILFGIRLSGSRTLALQKELTSSDYDEATGKYKLILTTEDTDLTSGRHYYDCALLDGDGEKHRIASGRVIVKESYV